MDGGGTDQYVLLLHVAKFPHFPQSLRRFLGDPAIVKAGRNIGGDAAKIARDFPARGDFQEAVKVNSLLELGSSCAKRGLVPDGRVGLDKLCLEILSFQLPKPPGLRMSEWNKDLSEAHQKYAAADAWASLAIAQVVVNTPDPTIKLDESTAVVGLEVYVMIGDRRVATGVITDDASWYGHTLADRKRGGMAKKRVVVSVRLVHSPAAIVPHAPKAEHTPDEWSRHAAPYTLGALLVAYGGAFKLLVNISSLRPSMDN